MPPLVQLTACGLYCAAGDFFIDPWKPVRKAVITHAHADHACRGCETYLTEQSGLLVLQTRMSPGADIKTVRYGEVIEVGGVKVSLHPAGHILGSSQVRIEAAGEVWVVSGDYRLASDATCVPFETVPCHTFISECTFGLPIYRWPAQEEVIEDINHWWGTNRDEKRPSLLYAYALGKAQRIIANVDASMGPIYCHGAVEKVNADYRHSGVTLAPTLYATAPSKRAAFDGALIIAPPSASGTAWTRRFGDAATGFASGWMQVRGARRRRSVDRGFVISDHADWPGLLTAIKASGAQRVLLTHGRTGSMVRWLRESGIDADSLHTELIGERDDVDIDAQDDVEAET